VTNFTGTSGADSLNGSSAADRINRLGGDDRLYGMAASAACAR